ncbi:alpha/beta hydrolase family protein [Lysobacter solisilvae (ex Woo and Kim 2020)]|uniref:alpha/beta hydrolase family protein n=1 Tax=Agrilutibacter terrestris TaxID=2865112 RepID=UPI001CEC1413|nr:S9 family peptidase [Lysobacter terrestris]
MSKLYGAALALMLPGVVAAAPSIADFVKHPTYSGVKISPNGEYLAMTVDRGDQDVLTVLRTKDLSLVKVNQLPDDKSVGNFYWVSPERLMFNSVQKFGRFARPFGTGEWYAVNADGSQPRPLVFYGTRDATQKGKQVGAESFSLLDTLRDDDTNVLMSVNYPRSSDGAGTEVVLFDTLSGRRKSLARAPRENCEIALDAAKTPRFAVCYDQEDAQGNYDSHNELYRRGDDGKWTLVNSSKVSGKRLSVVGTAGDGRVYATQSDGKAPEAFGTIDTATGTFQELFSDPVSDPASYIMSADDETVLGVVTEAGAPRVKLIEESHPDAEIYASLAGAFPGQFVDFSSATKDGKKIVVSVYSDSNPGELYLYDRDTGKARFLMRGRQWLDAEQMARVKSFSITTRDGLKLHGYLTIPKGSSGKNLPMIVNVHGGPMGPRDNWGFNWETQLLASRGYLVMQVNYRGSGGFGKAFQDMAYGQWADGIMNDVLDATKWTIAQGYADKDRVCIYGGSFGGYASLMAPTREQGVFKCAFGYVGAYDADVQMTLSDTSKREDGIRYLKRALGDTKAERDRVMPVNHADKVKIPVYLAAGARDPRCPPENTERMYKALINAGNPPEGMIIQSGEMHGFYKEENNLKLYTEMLNFFDRHIGPKKVAQGG